MIASQAARVRPLPAASVLLVAAVAAAGCELQVSMAGDPCENPAN